MGGWAKVGYLRAATLMSCKLMPLGKFGGAMIFVWSVCVDKRRLYRGSMV